MPALTPHLSEIIGLASDLASVVGVIAAVIVAVWAKSDAKASTAEASRSREVAQDARDAQVRMADALERMSSGAPPAEAEAGPEVEFLIERRGKNQLALRNLGPKKATGVTIPEGQGGITRNLPDGVTLDPFQSHDFLIVDAMQSRAPAEVKVISDQSPDGVWVRIPPSL